MVPNDAGSGNPGCWPDSQFPASYTNSLNINPAFGEEEMPLVTRGHVVTYISCVQLDNKHIAVIKLKILQLLAGWRVSLTCNTHSVLCVNVESLYVLGNIILFAIIPVPT